MGQHFGAEAATRLFAERDAKVNQARRPDLSTFRVDDE
jgi:hypothetical protein